MVESAQHLFLYCAFFSSLWQQVRFWISIDGVDRLYLKDHFIQFTVTVARYNLGSMDINEYS